MKKPIVSLLQMDVKIADVRHNMEKAAKLFEKAASRRSDFICLPEMWSTGFAYEDFLTIAKASFEDTI
ncbi:MAG: nitrilase-related carbon-nitrogen hydrolase, partial [Candidatus Margulisiibacteriota bacterium]